MFSRVVAPLQVRIKGVMWRPLRDFRILIFTKKVKRATELIEFLEAQVVAQSSAHPGNHGAHDRIALFVAYLGKHHSDDDIVLVPPGHIDLPSRELQTGKQCAEHGL